MTKKTIKAYKSIPAGSAIVITVENKKSYRGTWSSMLGTYVVTIPKVYFKKEIPTEELSTEIYAVRQRKYYDNHRESWNDYQREYKRRKYNDDPVYRARLKEYQRIKRIEKLKANA